MTLARASLLTGIAALLSNRILAVGVGIWLKMPVVWMLTFLVVLDAIQIPFYYWLYEHSHLILCRLPARWGELFKKPAHETTIGRWTASLGGFGVFLVAALPALGGGMWTAIFLAYGLKLDRRLSYLSLVAGSLVSYFATYWVVDAVFVTVRDIIRYFG